MSKRSREGDVLLMRSSPCVLKRPAPLLSDQVSKRQRLPISDACTASLKRPAAFDIELDHMHKRLRATVPTAEEAIAFLIPHMTKLRNLYCESQTENRTLKRHLNAVNNAYMASLEQNASLNRQLDASKAEVAELRRQVEMMKYRFVLADQASKRRLNP